MGGSMIFKIYWDMGRKIILLIVEIERNDQKYCQGSGPMVKSSRYGHIKACY